MKRFLPFIILLAIIVVYLILPLRYTGNKGLVIILVLIELVGVPLTVLSMQRKEAWKVQLSATIGFVVGAVAGFYIGMKIVDFITNAIYGDLSEYEIRLDLLLGACLGASIFSSIGAVVGGRISRRRKEKNNT